MKKKIKKEKKGINKYIIIGAVLICLFGFTLINRSNDGELNDYENYEPEVEVNESEEGESEEIDAAVQTIKTMMTYLIPLVVILTLVMPFLRRGDFI